MRLADLAHVRAGDKGDTAILAVIAYDPADLPVLTAALQVGSLAEHFATSPARIDVHPLPALGAVTVVVRDRLDGGVTRSAGVDPHGKTLSAHLLEFPITPTAPQRDKEEK
ncbi:MAG: hypothetical protein J0H23_06890 [Micrococcales bacterium]|nr:hypothetical protein [Micrococcales bacterium]OJX67590.1 MAG: hypothetical protein BGO94_01850 [Micrococcales bacterium 72-143]